MDHPSRDELAAFCREELPGEREMEVLDHLLGERCSECLAAVPPPLRAMLGSEPAGPEQDAAYEAAIDRAMEAALGMDRHLRRQRAQTDWALKALAAGDQIPRNTDDLARMDALLEWSWQLRHENPKRMAELAWSAAMVSLRLDPAIYGPERVRDYQAEAHAELGNAYRAANRFLDAEQALGHARRLSSRALALPTLRSGCWS